MGLKKTALHKVHIDLGAKMAPFAGFDMPVRYTSEIEEHKAVRNSVGMFDISHMGEFILKGPNALDLIQRITSNDASKLHLCQAQYSCLINEKSGIVDDLLVYRIDEEEYMLVVNASNIEKDRKWILNYNNKGVEIKNISDEITLIAIQGPKAIEVLQKLTPVKLEDLKFYTFTKGKIAGVSDILISATGYTGSGGFEIYFENDQAKKIWNNIFEAGTEFGIKPIGLVARDTLRLEMGFCLYGNDIDDSTSPIEAGLGWITKFTKDFTNSKDLLAQKVNGVERKLIGFEMKERGIPRSHYEIIDANEKNIGNVTSGTQSPSLGTGIGMGYVNTAYSEPGTEIFIRVRNRQLKAKVLKMPFYRGE